METLQDALRARDDLLAVIAHDLQNPLQAMALRAQLLAAGEGSTAEHAAAITRSVEMMQRLVRGLVDLASLDAGTLRFSKAPTELRTLVQDAASIAAPLAATRRVQLTLDVAAMPPLILDRERLVWVLSTLLLSAVRLSGAGSTVTLRTERRDAELRFSIVGYRIFDRDFDRDFMPSPQGKGAALAPYLAKRLVEAQGGRICAARELEEGGAFWFSLPAIEAGQMELV